INNDSKEIQTSTPSERATEIEKETDQSINAALIKSPVFLDKDAVHKKTNNEIGSVNANRSLKPATVKVLSTKANDGNDLQVKKSDSNTTSYSSTTTPILSKKSKKKDKNSGVQAQFLENDLSQKDTDLIEDPHNLNIEDFQKISNESNEKDNLATNNSNRHNKMPIDFKFDFATSTFALSPNVSKGTNNDSISTQNTLENPSNPKSPSDSTFEFSSSNIFSKDFNFNASSIFNLQTSFSSASPLFGSSDNNSPGSPIMMNGDPSPWNNSAQSSNSNTSNGVKTTAVSVEDLERQVANARREAEMLEHRLRALKSLENILEDENSNVESEGDFGLDGFSKVFCVEIESLLVPFETLGDNAKVDVAKSNLKSIGILL
ncbi:15231_t:CDS:2, partial [Racocetra persica]